ncbi:MAG: GNAT family N-acetyltransferase [Pseudomonadales bacterium]|nr:GNAT family N-acetyltransferase [Pseudomonadales bacterium]MCP5172698.1 GNAT family N-acetyltransferase [Pseudomonadales bacterium]MCP5302172.1 GNAT family N-acetyltransferase [Pseudomonadales bacterium]
MNNRYRRYKNYQELPESYSDLLTLSAEKGFFYDRPWLEFLMEKYYSDESEMCLIGVEQESDGKPLFLAPLRMTRSDGAVFGARTLTSIGHMENYSLINFLFSPCVPASEYPILLSALMKELREGCDQLGLPAADVIRLWPAERGSELASLVHQSLRNAGYYVQVYDNSYNQYEVTTDLDYEGYFQSRSSNHRYNVRRRERNLEKEGRVKFELCTDDKDAEKFQKLLDGYILSSVVSWKEPGSMVSKGILDLIKLTAERGCMRLGVLYLDDRPVAAQYWVVSGGVASCLRLGYDEKYKKEAPGVVLTGFMIQHLLDQDGVGLLDYGYGNDEYKKKWTKDSRFYVGFMAFNSSTWRGRYFAAKHILGRKVKRKLARFSGKNGEP